MLFFNPDLPEEYIRTEQLFIIALLFGRMIFAMSQETVIPGAVKDQAPRTSGIVLHSPFLYDFTVWLAFFGKEQAFRGKVLDLARLAAGESVLDAGCGTGTLAIAAKRRVGPTARSGCLSGNACQGGEEIEEGRSRSFLQARTDRVSPIS
jgi:SAM-dependent methyltransferase